MKKITLSRLFLFAFAAILLSACSATQKSRTYDYDHLFITKQGIIQRPLIADMEVGKQKQTISRTYKNVTVATAKQNVIEEFIRTNNADLIVQPLFTTDAQSTSMKTTVVITLSGYPATYKNIRNYEPKDKETLLPCEYIIGAQNSPTRTTSEGVIAPKKKKNNALAAIGLTAIIGGVVAAATTGGL